MKIQILADSVINKIAAGEVVERPVSVVRELLDNAIDAGATELFISIERGGRGSIEVVDNGSGMERDDALLAFERHATSKIKAASDLTAIQSYGFRGEALASIAAVSSVSLISREEASREGVEIQLRGGVIQSVSSVAAPVGTTIRVQNLFFNMPARKKFLRKEVTEERRIKSWITQFALANPRVRLRLCFDGKESLVLPPDNDYLARARRLFRGTTVLVEGEENDIAVQGLVGHPSLAQYDAATFTIIVNGRVVTDRLLLKAVREGFDSTLKEREIPTGSLFIQLPADQVDVNVHPQKSEVRFLNPTSVFQVVRQRTLQATRLFRAPMSTPPSRPVEQPYHSPRVVETVETAGTIAFTSVGAETAPARKSDEPQAALASTHSEQFASFEQSDFSFSTLRYIGQALNCYLLCEGAGKFVVVDMHAAHERINFNLIRSGYANSNAASQQLLLPISVTLSPESCDLFEQEQHTLERLGFEIDRLGEESIAVRSVPTILAGKDIVDCIKQLAANEFASALDGRYQQFINHVAARIACHASIRSGYAIKREEVYALFSRLDSHEFSAACPHGRPVVVSFSEGDVEKWFGRDR